MSVCRPAELHAFRSYFGCLTIRRIIHSNMNNSNAGFYIPESGTHAGEVQNLQLTIYGYVVRPFTIKLSQFLLNVWLIVYHRPSCSSHCKFGRSKDPLGTPVHNTTSERLCLSIDKWPDYKTMWVQRPYPGVADSATANWCMRTVIIYFCLEIFHI